MGKKTSAYRRRRSACHVPSADDCLAGVDIGVIAVGEHHFVDGLSGRVDGLGNSVQRRVLGRRAVPSHVLVDRSILFAVAGGVEERVITPGERFALFLFLIGHHLHGVAEGGCAEGLGALTLPEEDVFLALDRHPLAVGTDVPSVGFLELTAVSQRTDLGQTLESGAVVRAERQAVEMADAVHFVGDVEHLLDVVVHQRLGVMRPVVGVAETDGVDGDGLGTGSDGGFFEIIDVILVVEGEIVVSDSTDEDVVLVVIDAGGDVLPVVASGIGGCKLNSHCQRPGRGDGNDSPVVTGVLVAVRPDEAWCGAGAGETADLLHHTL